MRLSTAVAASAAFVAGANAWGNYTGPVYTTEVVTAYTTYCPEATKITHGGVTYTVTAITIAHYKGVQGELPFQYWDKTNVKFADCRTHSGEFATLEYSDDQPTLYLGEFVEFDSLKFKNLRQFEGW